MIDTSVAAHDPGLGNPAFRGVSERVTVRWTILEPGRPDGCADVSISAPAGTRLETVSGPLLTAVEGAVAAAGPPQFFVDGEPVGCTVIGHPPLLDGAVVTLGRPGGPPGRSAGTAGGLLEVHVAAGPDAGARFPLPPGTVRVGRGGQAVLRVADPDVSRAHAEVMRDHGAVHVRDTGSTNGTVLDGRPVGAQPREWPVGGRLQVGGSVLVLRVCDGDPSTGGGPASAHPDGSGRLMVNRVPRMSGPPFTARVSFPGAPADSPRPRVPWVAAALPLVLCLPLAWWLRQPSLLAFMALSPLTVIVQYLVDRRSRRLEHAAVTAQHAAAVAEAHRALAACLAQEARGLHLDHPDLAALGAAASGPLQRLWDRRRGDPDVLTLRLGLGEREPATGTAGDGAPRPMPRLSDVPVTLELRSAGVAGITGPRHEVLGLARALVGQAAVRHSPRDLRVVVLTATPDAAADWSWAGWLPHADGALPAIRERAVATPAPSAAPADPAPTLLVLDGAERLRRHPSVAALLAAGPRSGVHTLALADDAARLPAECGAVVELAAGGVARLTVHGQAWAGVRPDLASPAWAERLARDLARLRDATPAEGEAGLPTQVRLLDLLGGDGAIDPRSIASGWRRRRQNRSRATTAPVARTTHGVWELDLHRDGPHALIAGTTGAGKSELLTTLVIALAAMHPPDRLQLLLVDYKGGTAFAPLARLPHVTGVITDLDAALAARALASLRAELRRREALLRTAGAADVDGYDTGRPAGDAPLTRLVIVVDEFRVLADELPELLSGLVRVAAVGRSLGVHLVLATQRPAGAVSADIRANVNLRIALRVRDRVDSDDVIDAPDAAGLPPERPGRGIFRVGGADPVPFQAARVTGQSAPAAGPVVRRLRQDDAVPTRWVPAEAGGSFRPAFRPAEGAGAERPYLRVVRGPSDDLTRLVEACRAAAAAEGLPPAPPPWLPPLPAALNRDDVNQLVAPGGEPQPTRLTVGLLDLPQEQRRGALVWDVRQDGHLAIVGAPGSGRTTTIRALVSAALAADRPCHVHVLDGGGRLGDLERLPSIGTVAPVTDLDRVDRLFQHLAGHDGDARASPPGVLLLIDGWEQALDAWYPFEHGRPVDDLVRLARSGSGRGLRIAVTGGRGVLAGALASVLTERWLLRAADPTDLVVAGVPTSALPAEMPPGRLLRIVPGGAVEAQIALPEPSAPPLARAAEDGLPPHPPVPSPDGAAAAGAPLRPPVPAPLRLRRLPQRLGVDELLAMLREMPPQDRAGRVLIGLGGDQATPAGPPAEGPGWLVAGAPGSGRSSALAVAGRVLLADERRVVVLARDGPLAALGRYGADVVDPSLPALGLLARLDATPGSTLILDDAGWLSGALDERLADRLTHPADGEVMSPAGRWPRGDGPHLLVACTPAQAAMAFRGVLPMVRDRRIGLLVGAVGPGDGEALGVHVAPRPAGPGGRALLVSAGRIHVIHLADPQPEGRADVTV
ncbi:MAG TPA: FtsK/SpoIIIE domain-containing protein [Kineosporiaceae bacterium]